MKLSEFALAALLSWSGCAMSGTVSMPRGGDSSQAAPVAASSAAAHQSKGDGEICGRSSANFSFAPSAESDAGSAAPPLARKILFRCGTSCGSANAALAHPGN
ncbi:MAG: hypothetical protein ABI589_15740 [Burkholderiales bacterium]